MHGGLKQQIEDYRNRKSLNLQGSGKELPQPSLARPVHKGDSEALEQRLMWSNGTRSAAMILIPHIIHVLGLIINHIWNITTLIKLKSKKEKL